LQKEKIRLQAKILKLEKEINEWKHKRNQIDQNDLIQQEEQEKIISSSTTELPIQRTHAAFNTCYLRVEQGAAFTIWDTTTSEDGGCLKCKSTNGLVLSCYGELLFCFDCLKSFFIEAAEIEKKEQ
jgi:hypothetical protein